MAKKKNKVWWVLVAFIVLSSVSNSDKKTGFGCAATDTVEKLKCEQSGGEYLAELDGCKCPPWSYLSPSSICMPVTDEIKQDCSGLFSDFSIISCEPEPHLCVCTSSSNIISYLSYGPVGFNSNCQLVGERVTC